jgi:hypothetical protein
MTVGDRVISRLSAVQRRLTPDGASLPTRATQRATQQCRDLDPNRVSRCRAGHRNRIRRPGGSRAAAFDLPDKACVVDATASSRRLPPRRCSAWRCPIDNNDVEQLMKQIALVSVAERVRGLRRVGQAERRPTGIKANPRRWAGAPLVPPYVFTVSATDTHSIRRRLASCKGQLPAGPIWPSFPATS